MHTLLQAMQSLAVLRACPDVEGWLVALLLLLLVLTLLRVRTLGAKRERLVQEKELVYRFVHDVSEAFVETDSKHVDFLLKRLLFYAQQTTKAGAGAVFFADEDGGNLRARAVAGLFPPLVGAFDSAEWARTGSKFQYLSDFIRAQTVVRGSGLIGDVAEKGVAVLIEDAERDPRVPQHESEYLRVFSAVLVPMRFKNAVLGVLVVVNRVDERPFGQAELDLLQALADQASFTIYFAKFNEELNKKRLMDYDLSLARNIQTGLLPKHIPRVPGLDMAAFSIPAREVGGDYYDFVQVDDTHVGIAVADVSGKGVTGAIMMSICRSVFRAHAPGCLSPARVLRAINSVITQDIYEDMFVSMLYIVLDISAFSMSVARAGHNAPFVIGPDRAGADSIEPGGVAIGLADADTFNECLEEIAVQLNPGDMLVAYTDGVTEAANERGEQWELAGLQRVARQHFVEGAASVVGCVREELARFAGDAAPCDDMTLVVVRRKPEESRDEQDQAKATS